MTPFEGKTVIVTGANSGIGEAIVVAFAHAGANTFGIARAPNTKEVARAKHPEVRWLAADVVNPDEVEEAVVGAVDETGRIDTLVNNAGLFELVSLEDSSDEMIRRQ